MGRGTLLAWTLVPQAVLMLAGLGVSATSSILSRRSLPEPSPLLNRLFLIMGNLVALPQLILLFAMLDIILYNIYGIRLMPLWAFAVIVMVLGAALLAVFFARAIRQARRARAKNLQE